MNPEEVQQAQTREEARQCAIEWQIWSGYVDMSWSDVLEWQGVFTALAIKFGLTEEFQENGII